MQRFAAQIDYYLKMFRRGDTEDAFHGLLEIDRDILPELIETYREQQDVCIREYLVEVMWEYREQSIIPFLGEVLRDSESRVWRQALNGLVALASPAAIDVLHGAKTHQLKNQCDTKEFHRWLEEATEQAEAKMNERI